MLHENRAYLDIILPIGSSAEKLWQVHITQL